MPKLITSGPYRTFRDLNPGETYIEYEGSTITIPLQVKIKDHWEVERLKLAAFMRLEVFPAYISGLGTREFQFIIRDWELYGHSRLLNKLFMGDELGNISDPTIDPRDGFEQAVMTFTIADHYEKYGDDDNLNLARASELEINDITHHDQNSGNIYWQIEKGAKDGFSVVFHRKPPDEKGIAILKDKKDHHYILGEVSNITSGSHFKTTLKAERNTVWSFGNTVLDASMKLRTPISISWKLGRDPKPGAHGKIHIVSPPKSLCVADRGPIPGEAIDSLDFPARISYSASYHIYINNTRFVEDQAGIAIAVGIDQIPPIDVKVAFEKPHEGKLLGKYFKFDSGDCTGMNEIREEEYRFGVATAKYWRSNRLDVTQGERSDPPPTRLG